MFRLRACSMFQRLTRHMYVHINTRTQIPLDTYKQVYHQTEIRLNYAKCYNLREILLICVRCCSNMSNILFNQATFHAIGQDPFLAWPKLMKPSFWGDWNPKNVSNLVFLLRHIHKNRLCSQIDELWPEKTNIQGGFFNWSALKMSVRLHVNPFKKVLSVRIS